MTKTKIKLLNINACLISLYYIPLKLYSPAHGNPATVAIEKILIYLHFFFKKSHVVAGASLSRSRLRVTAVYGFSSGHLRNHRARADPRQKHSTPRVPRSPSLSPVLQFRFSPQSPDSNLRYLEAARRQSPRRRRACRSFLELEDGRGEQRRAAVP